MRSEQAAVAQKVMLVLLQHYASPVDHTSTHYFRARTSSTSHSSTDNTLMLLKQGKRVSAPCALSNNAVARRDDEAKLPDSHQITRRDAVG